MNALDAHHAREMHLLLAWRHGEISRVAAAGGELFMGIPDDWYEEPRFGCAFGHVARMIISGSSGDRCQSCGRPMAIIPHMTEAEFEPISASVMKAALENPA